MTSGCGSAEQPCDIPKQGLREGPGAGFRRAKGMRTEEPKGAESPNAVRMRERGARSSRVISQNGTCGKDRERASDRQKTPILRMEFRRKA